MSFVLRKPEDAFRLLVELGAPPRLIRHHELVVEAAMALCQGLLEQPNISFHGDDVLIGAALHDVGKILYPDEMQVPGHQHETAGQAMLLERGLSPEIARFCVTHASWAAVERTLEDLLVALADKLWKGRREEELESRVVRVIAVCSRLEPWQVFDQLDTLFEQIAAEGTSRLARSLT